VLAKILHFVVRTAGSDTITCQCQTLFATLVFKKTVFFMKANVIYFIHGVDTSSCTALYMHPTRKYLKSRIFMITLLHKRYGQS